MSQRREAGLGYNCPSKFSQEHIKECSMKGIYLLKIDPNAPTDDDTVDANDGSPHISINALTGTNTSLTMHLDVVMAGLSVRAPVDTVSTHYFIDAATPHHVGLTPLPLPGLTVGVADGDHIPCDSICLDVPVVIGTEHFAINFFIITLGGFNGAWLSVIAHLGSHSLEL
jgi:hypothetical protein